jgi:C-terminal processing protease CtpA/Prc
MPFEIDIIRASYFRLTCVAVAIALVTFWGVREFKYRTSPMVPEREAIITDSIALMRTNSIVGKQIDWQTLKAEALAIASRTGNEADLDGAFEHIAARLEDGHSFYMSRADSEKIETATSLSSSTSIANEVSVADGVPRIQVNSFVSVDPQMTTFASRQLREQVNKAVAESKCGVIVDLSKNSGGNMYPMLQGLLPLLPARDLLQFESANGTRTAVTANAGAIGFGNQEVLPALESRYMPLPRIVPTAVILASTTGSAGEMVAIAFKGRSDVRFFGQRTFGAVTGNTPFKLKHGGVFALATSWTLDGHGKRYVEALTPDETLSGVNAHSKALKSAEVWVRQQCAVDG